MNATAQTFVTALASVVAAAALGIGLANGMSAPAEDVVKLERVVVVGKATDTAVVAQLPRVVVEGRRTVEMASAQPTARAF